MNGVTGETHGIGGYKVYTLKKNWRRKGVYSLLHNEVISRCKKSKESCGVRLYVDKENKIAQKVYRELGMFENNYLLYETNFQH